MLLGSASFEGNPHMDDWEKNSELVETLESIELVEGEPMKLTKVGMNLSLETKVEIVQFLKENLDIFTWRHHLASPEYKSQKKARLAKKGFLS